MTLLQRAGVDLSRPETVRAVVDQLDALVSQLEKRSIRCKAAVPHLRIINPDEASEPARRVV